MDEGLLTLRHSDFDRAYSHSQKWLGSTVSRESSLRGRHGGVEKRGGWKTSRMTPLPKRGFGPPSHGTFSTPLRCQCSVFPVKKSTTEQTRSSFGGVQKFSEECVLWCVFLPPYVCARNPPERSSCEIFRRDRRKMRRNFGEIFRRFSSFNFQGKWPQKISRKILDIFHGAPN